MAPLNKIALKIARQSRKAKQAIKTFVSTKLTRSRPHHSAQSGISLPEPDVVLVDREDASAEVVLTATSAVTARDNENSETTSDSDSVDQAKIKEVLSLEFSPDQLAVTPSPCSAPLERVNSASSSASQPTTTAEPLSRTTSNQTAATSVLDYYECFTESERQRQRELKALYPPVGATDYRVERLIGTTGRCEKWTVGDSEHFFEISASGLVYDHVEFKLIKMPSQPGTESRTNDWRMGRISDDEYLALRRRAEEDATQFKLDIAKSYPPRGATDYKVAYQNSGTYREEWTTDGTTRCHLSFRGESAIYYERSTKPSGTQPFSVPSFGRHADADEFWSKQYPEDTAPGDIYNDGFHVLAGKPQLPRRSSSFSAFSA